MQGENKHTMRRGLLALMLLLALAIPSQALAGFAPALELTNQELAYLSQMEVLQVLTAPDSQPYIYQNEGVSIAILERLCATAKISLALVPAVSTADALRRLEQGEADLTAVKISPRQDAALLLPYLRAPLQMVSYKHAQLEEQSSLSLAVLESEDFEYAEKYAFVNQLYYANVRDCLGAVRARHADVLLCDIYQLSVFADSFAAQDLLVTTLPQRDVCVGFGLHSTTDPLLISALERTVASFSTTELGSLLLEHAQNRDLDFRLAQFVYKNPFELLCAAAALFFVILLCLFVFFRVRTGQHQELRGYEESYRMLANTFGEAGMEYDFLNDRLTFFGGRRDRIDVPDVVEQVYRQLARRTVRLSLTPQDLDMLLTNTDPGRSYEVELQCGMKEGSWNWFRMIYIVVCTSESHRRPIRLIGCLVNIQQERQERERLLKIGRNDQLTGLYNRAAAEERITATLAEGAGPVSLFFLDIDYFKGFNDRHGHSCGDAVLIAVGQALREIFAQEAILCRWGGDEFLIFVQSHDQEAQRQRFALLRQRMQAFSYQERALPVTCSVGGATAWGAADFSALFELADTTLYQVKSRGRDGLDIASLPPPTREVP